MALEPEGAELIWSGRDGILILDAETGCILDVNPFLTELLGFSRDTLRGKRIGELDLVWDRPLAEALLERVRREGYANCDDLPLRTREGRTIPVSFVGNSYLVDKTPIILLNVCERI